jgi:hypothetical protein
MIARYASFIIALITAWPALAEPLDADAARRFVVGKQFAFTCFDGSRGVGRIFADGSVMGTFQIRGSEPARSVWLPAGTLRVKGDRVCGSLRGIPIEPCFDLDKTDDQSFRGSVSGLDSAYCEFTKVVEQPSRRKWSAPLPLDPEQWRRIGP